MKKQFSVFGFITMSVMAAFAKNIDFDTPVKWNSDVIEQALIKSGFIHDVGAAWDVQVTHTRILADLLDYDSFSLRDATSVCMNKCNMSDFLKNGRGASGKKCPELCKGFADTLLAVNNSFISSGYVAIGSEGLVEGMPDGTYKVWSRDKKYYALIMYNAKIEKLKQYRNICSAKDSSDEHWFFDNTSKPVIVFETQNNRPVGLFGVWGEDGAIWIEPYCQIDEYNSFEFSISFNSGISSDGKPTELEVKDLFASVSNQYAEDARQIRSALNSMQNIDIIGSKPYIKDSEYNRAIKAKQEAQNWLLKYENAKSDYSALRKLDWAGGIVSSLDSTTAWFKVIEECIRDVKAKNGKTIDWTDRQTAKPQMAYDMAIRNMQGGCWNTLDEKLIKCSGDCNKMWGSDDTVTCTFNDITVKYVFDDICDKSILGF